MQIDHLEKLAEAVGNQTPVKDWSELQVLLEKGMDWCVQAGGSILAALVIFFVGRALIYLIKKILDRILSRDKIDKSIQSFVRSLVSILLNILLAIAIISKLGIETTSFAALLASAGVAVGMALSGNLQNFAGGLLVLIFRPYRVGDFIECHGISGTVKEIQIFHTIVVTTDSKCVFIPNGQMSSGNVTNYTREGLRRIEWTVGVEYGEEFSKVSDLLVSLSKEDSRILTDPAPFVALSALSASSVDIILRVWVKSADYWDVYFEMNRNIYEAFNRAGINFPYPQITVHQG